MSKPPLPSDSHAEIEDWIRRVMPDLHPLVERLDATIRRTIPALQFARVRVERYRAGASRSV